MAFAMTRCTFDHGLAVGDTRHLRSARNAIDIGTECDDWFTASPSGPPGRGNIGNTGFHAEAVCFENCCQVALGFKLLEPKFGERKQAVDNFLHHFGAIIDTSNGFSLEATEACLGSDCGDCGESENRDS